MLQADKYSAIETSRDGRRLEIRALTPDDRSDLIAAVACTSAESLRRRFFVPKNNFTDRENGLLFERGFHQSCSIGCGDGRRRSNSVSWRWTLHRRATRRGRNRFCDRRPL